MILRLIRLSLTLIAFMIRAFFTKLFNKGNALNRKLTILTSKYSAKIMRIFNVTIELEGAELLADDTPCLILSNHMSYLDILFIAAVKRSMFLSHTGIQREPFIGWFASAGGAYFVDRSSTANLNEELQKLGDFLKSGNTVTLYPEGTTGNGEGIMPFHSAFINAAVTAGVDVLPLCIQYEEFNGEPITKENRCSLMIFGDMPFMPHIKQVCRLMKSARIKIYTGQRISSKEHSRKEISNIARQWMIDTFRPVE